MRRAIVTLVAISALGTGAGARADFHPACQPPAAAVAEVGLVFDGQYIGDPLTFLGRVTCTGADTIEIVSLTLTPIVLPGPPASGEGQNCTTGGCTTVTSSGEIASFPGIYEVFMRFRVTKGALQFAPSRVGRWLWPGAGAPVRIA